LVIGVYRVPFAKVLSGPENILEIGLKAFLTGQGFAGQALFFIVT
jgi:hypothetical protein